MENSNMPHQDGMGSGPYPPDKTWGIIIVVLSAIMTCCAIAGILGVGAVSAIGGAAAARSGTPGAGAAAAAVGGVAMMLVIFGAVISAVCIYAGTQVMVSKRLGFQIVAVVSAIGILMNLRSLLNPISAIVGIIFIGINGAFLYYSYSRLSGKQGPPPLA